MRVLLLLLALLFFVLSGLVVRQRAASPDADAVVGLVTASPLLLVGVLLAVSALFVDRRD